MQSIHLQIVTPEKVLYESDVDSITCTTEQGQITILPNHSALVSVLLASDAHIVKQNEIIPIVVGQGVLQVSSNHCYMMVNTAEHIDGIDLERAESAASRARAFMDSKEFGSDIEFARVQALLDRNLARIKAVQKWKK